MIVRLLLVLVVFIMNSCCREDAKITGSHPSRDRASLLYWLSDVNLDEIRKSSFTYVVIDYSSTGDRGGQFSRKAIESLRDSLPGRREVFCYLSVGEAESYRFYWQDGGWKAPKTTAPGAPFGRGGRPSFLGPENPVWKGNYLVDYRHPDWQKILLEYLDILIAQGFDGVCLDKVDSYETLECAPFEIPQARQAMIELVARLSTYGKSKKRGFRIIVHNGEELAWKEGRPNRAYLDSLDGICREDTFIDGRKRRPPDAIRDTVSLLKAFTRSGKVVFTIDYPDLTNREEILWVTREAEKYGFIEYCAPPGLDGIPAPR